MPENMSVLTIPVNSEQLKEALSLYEKLNAAAEKFNSKYGSPLDNGGGHGWGGVPPGGVGGGGGGSEGGQGGDKDFLNNVNKLVDAVEKSFDQINKTLDTTTSKLKGLFESAIIWSLKIALLGTGSSFGYGLIAKNAGRQLMDAQGNQMSTGQIQAAHNVYGNRFDDVDSVIQGLTDAQRYDSPYRAGIMGLGLDPDAGPGKNIPLYYQKMADLAAQNNGSGLAYAGVSRLRLEGMTSLNAFNQIAANQKDMPGFNRLYESTANRLEMSEKVGRGFQEVTTTLDTTNDRIFNSFKTALSSLNEPIKKLSITFADAVDAFLSGPNGKYVFTALGEGIKTFSEWIGNKEFQKDMGEFSRAVVDIVKAIGSAVIWIGGLLPTGDKKEGETREEYKARKQKERADAVAALKDKSSFTDKSGAEAKSDGSISGLFSAIGKTTWGLISTVGGKVATSIAEKVPDPLAQLAPKYSPDGNGEGAWKFRAGNEGLFKVRGLASGNQPVQHAQAARRSRGGDGLPPNLLNVVEQAESGGNRFAVSKAGAMGPFQFMPGTAKDMGLCGGEVFDKDLAEAAARRYFQMLFKRYEGDAAKAVAAYNWGMGNVDKYGLTSLPKETYDYLRKILPQIGEADSLDRIAMRGTQQSQAGTQSRVVIDVALNQAPGSDINAQLRSNMPPPIIIPF